MSGTSETEFQSLTMFEVAETMGVLEPEGARTMSTRGLGAQMAREGYMRNVVTNLIDNIERVGDPEPSEGRTGSSSEPARADRETTRVRVLSTVRQPDWLEITSMQSP